MFSIEEIENMRCYGRSSRARRFSCRLRVRIANADSRGISFETNSNDQLWFGADWRWPRLTLRIPDAFAPPFTRTESNTLCR